MLTIVLSRSIVAACVAAALTAPAFAGQDPAAPQQPPPTGRGGGRAGRAGAQPANPNVMNVAQVERYFDGYMILQARTALQLSDDQYFAIGPRLERLQELRRQVQRDRRLLLGELRQMIRPDAAAADDAVLAAKVKALDDVPAQYAEQIRKAYADIDSGLTPRQRARFRTFEEMMEQQKLDLLARARQQIKPADPQAPPATPQKGGGGRR